MSSCYTIHHLPEEERPRERLMRHGVESVSTTELLAILLGSGIKGRHVLQLAAELVSHFGSLKQLSEATVEELCQIKGLGQAKAIQLKASFALGVRLSQVSSIVKYKVDTPVSAYNLIKESLETEKSEHFITILLDTKGYVIKYETVSIGTLSNTLIHPREVFYPAIRHKAASIILAHNHPSGDPTPSRQDFEVTKKLTEVGELIGIKVNDHIVIGQGSYISMRQQGFEFISV